MRYVFPGTPAEASELTSAIMRYCDHKTVNGVMQPGSCPAHELLAPNYVKHLLTVRRSIERYLLAEFNQGEKAQ